MKRNPKSLPRCPHCHSADISEHVPAESHKCNQCCALFTAPVAAAEPLPQPDYSKRDMLHDFVREAAALPQVTPLTEAQKMIIHSEGRELPAPVAEGRTPPHRDIDKFQMPSDSASRDEIIGALQYWVRRAKAAENAADRMARPSPGETTSDEAMRLLTEAHAAFCDMAGANRDTRWMLETEIVLSGGYIPKRGLSCGELKKLIPRFRSQPSATEGKTTGS